MSLKMVTSKQEAIAKTKKKEAKARRKLAKRWDIISNGIAYKKASVKEFSRRTTLLMEEQLFDGIFLELKCCNEDISYMAKQRMLRRIIEKKQAQAVHRQIGRTDDRFSGFMKRQSFRRSYKEICNYQRCA